MKTIYTSQAVRVISILPPLGPKISGTKFACWGLLESVLLAVGWGLLQQPWDAPQQIRDGLLSAYHRIFVSKLMGSFQRVEFLWLVGLVGRSLGWHCLSYWRFHEFSSSKLENLYALHLLLLKGVWSLAQSTGSDSGTSHSSMLKIALAWEEDSLTGLSTNV